MSWFKRVKDGILTSTENKKELKEGLWTKCPVCKKVIQVKDVQENFYICPCDEHDYHFRIGSKEYFKLLLDRNEFKELNANLKAKDVLEFVDTKPYPVRLEQASKKTKLHDAIRTVEGKMYGRKLVLAVMDFDFIGGSMGVVVGEKIARAIDHAIQHHLPFVLISKSGGARMMESAFSLMQMAKTSAKLAQLGDAGLPYISVLTDPTTGGVTASFAMLGDFNIAEPEALIGFAGPRVIKETIGKDLPKGFQRSEFLLEHGFLDLIVNRNEMKHTISVLIGHCMDDAAPKEAEQHLNNQKTASKKATATP